MGRFATVKGLEKALLGFIAALLVLPGILTVAVKSTDAELGGGRFNEWLRNRTLVSVEAGSFAPLRWQSLLNLKGRKAFERAFNRDYGGRELVVRLTNEGFYRVFNESTTSQVQFGAPGWIFETAYLREFFLERPQKKEVEALVAAISTIQKVCRDRGIGFAVLITPSKASLSQEYLPERWLPRFDERPRGYDLLPEMLLAHQVEYVDGRLLGERLKRAAIPWDVFPRGGAHWGSPLALETTHALADVLRRQGVPIAELRTVDTPGNDPYSKLHDSDQELIDADAATIANLALRWSYPVLHSRVLPALRAESRNLTGVFVAGSFTFRMVYQMMDTGQFDQIDTYYYYETLRSHLKGKKNPEISRFDTVDFDQRFFSADFLVLEVNEQRMSSGQSMHLNRFLKDALEYLPNPGAPKKPFRRIGYAPMKVGDELVISEGQGAKIASAALVGFTEPGGSRVWTEGKEALINLALPEAPGDGDAVTLGVETEAFIEGGLTEQKVEVFAGEMKIDEWAFYTDSRGGIKPIVIPRELMEDGVRARLKFVIGRPTSPYELGLSADERKLGICIKSMWRTGTKGNHLRSSPLEKGERLVLAPEQPDSAMPRSHLGFSASPDGVVWTVGSEADIHLMLKDETEGERVLWVQTDAFLASGLRSQKVTVFANGKKIGDWVFDETRNAGVRKLVIPPDHAREDGGVLLKFFIAHPTSPYESGLSADKRKLGIRIREIYRPTVAELRADELERTSW